MLGWDRQRGKGRAWRMNYEVESETRRDEGTKELNKSNAKAKQSILRRTHRYESHRYCYYVLAMKAAP